MITIANKNPKNTNRNIVALYTPLLLLCENHSEIIHLNSSYYLSLVYKSNITPFLPKQTSPGHI